MYECLCIQNAIIYEYLLRWWNDQLFPEKSLASSERWNMPDPVPSWKGSHHLPIVNVNAWVGGGLKCYMWVIFRNQENAILFKCVFVNKLYVSLDFVQSTFTFRDSAWSYCPFLHFCTVIRFRFCLLQKL